MSVFDGYEPDEGRPRVEPGDIKLKVVNVEETYAKSSGAEMLVITLHNVNGFELKYRLSKGEFFNRMLTNFYDGMGIPRGDKNMRAWIGRVGVAFVDYGKPNAEGRKYLEVKYFKPADASINPYAPKPQSGAPQAQKPAGDGFEDDTPFD